MNLSTQSARERIPLLSASAGGSKGVGITADMVWRGVQGWEIWQDIVIRMTAFGRATSEGMDS
jgi:hypothetical protein